MASYTDKFIKRHIFVCVSNKRGENLSLTDVSFVPWVQPHLARLNRVTYFKAFIHTVDASEYRISVGIRILDEYAHNDKHMKSSISLIHQFLTPFFFSLIIMLLIKPLLLLFITYAQCSPIYSNTNIFNSGCAKSTHQDFDIMQGLKPNLKNHVKFGKSSLYHLQQI